jgi:glycosyltransferase involved in cell wall biosynthesis
VRIAFDGHALTSPAGGVRRYTRELFGAIRRVAPSHTLIACGGDADQARGVGAAHIPSPASLPTNLGWALSGLPRAAGRAKADVFHAPAYTAPLWGARPLVLTLHDVSYARHPEWYPYHAGAVRQAFYARCAARADRILTDSAFSRAEIIAAYGIHQDRIDVVPLGVSDTFRPDPAVPREPVVLHVGDLHPRRNLPMLLDVVLALRADPRHARLRLVVAGTDRGSLAGLQAQAQQAGAPEVLHHVADATDTGLVGWYQRAAVMAYPSRYEGFGLPVAEAMACGTPVIAADAASMPEVLDGAGMLVGPDDARGWQQALSAVLDDDERASGMSSRGLARARALTWDRTAALTLDVYRRTARRVAGGPGL